jgi:hypothetical protein
VATTCVFNTENLCPSTRKAATEEDQLAVQTRLSLFPPRFPHRHSAVTHH